MLCQLGWIYEFIYDIISANPLLKSTDYPMCRNLLSLGLDQLIWQVTRPESRSCLDHMYLNNKSTVLSSSVPPIGMSDHCPVTVVRKHNGSFTKMNTHKTIKYRNYKNFDQASFCEDLVSAPWSLLHIADDPNEKLDLFEQVYTNDTPSPKGNPMHDYM